MGNFLLRGLDRAAWDSRYDDDLVDIKPRKAPDLLSHWFLDMVMPTFHNLTGEKIMVRHHV